MSEVPLYGIPASVDLSDGSGEHPRLPRTRVPAHHQQPPTSVNSS